MKNPTDMTPAELLTAVEESQAIANRYSGSEPQIGSKWEVKYKDQDKVLRGSGEKLTVIATGVDSHGRVQCVVENGFGLTGLRRADALEPWVGSDVPGHRIGSDTYDA